MEKIYHRIAKDGISPNQLYVLWSIREGIAPIGVNIAMEMRMLGQDWLDGNKLTGKAVSLLIDVDENFKDKKAKSDLVLMGKDYKEKIAEYRLIFPDTKLGSGKYARDSVKNLEPCFKWFFKNNEYTWETIMEATKKYMDEQDPKYMRTSKYFIKKSDKSGDVSSDLANYCEMLISGEGSTDSHHFSEKVV